MKKFEIDVDINGTIWTYVKFLDTFLWTNC